MSAGRPVPLLAPGAETFEQLIEVVPAEQPLALLQALVVQHEPLDDELPERFRGPDAELRGLVAVDPVADGDDGVEIVVLSLVGFPISGSMFQNGTY